MQHWTEDRIEKLKLLRARGFSTKEQAEALGVTVIAVYQKTHQLKLDDDLDDTLRLDADGRAAFLLLEDLRRAYPDGTPLRDDAPDAAASVGLTIAAANARTLKRRARDVFSSIGSPADLCAI